SGSPPATPSVHQEQSCSAGSTPQGPQVGPAPRRGAAQPARRVYYPLDRPQEPVPATRGGELLRDSPGAAYTAEGRGEGQATGLPLDAGVGPPPRDDRASRDGARAIPGAAFRGGTLAALDALS